MKKLRFFSLLAAVLALGLAFTACGDDSSGDPTSPPNYPYTPPFVGVTGISGVSSTGVKDVEFSLSGATVDPADATNQTIVWSLTSSTAGVTDISGGKFTPTAEGNVIIAATITNGAAVSSDYTQSFTITIIDPDNFVAVTGITNVPTTGTINTALDLSTVTVAPDNATFRTIVWSVPASAGSISGSTFTPAAAGTVTITGTITNGLTLSSNYTESFTITINDTATFTAVTNISEVPTAWYVDAPLDLSAVTVAPASATNKTIVWTVPEGKGTISGNTFTPSAEGTVALTATITNGLTESSNYTQEFSISVAAAFVPVTDISGVPETAIKNTLIGLNNYYSNGGYQAPYTTVTPDNATNQDIVWSVKTAGAGVTAITGTSFTPSEGGTLTITATIANGKTPSTDYIKDFTITVSDPYTGPAWTAPPMSNSDLDAFGSRITGIAYNGTDKWVAVSQAGRIRYSTDDGITWAGAVSPFSYNINGIAYGKADSIEDSKWVAVGSNGEIASSDTGENGTWTLAANSSFGTTAISGIANGNNRFVAAGNNKVAYSSHSGTWTQTSAASTYMSAMAYGGGIWIGGGSGGSMAKSINNGSTWVKIEQSIFSSASGIDNDFRSIAYGNGTWIAVGSRDIATSTDDGATWTKVTNNPFDYTSGWISGVRAIAYGNGTWVAGGIGGKIATSKDDGATWTLSSDSTFLRTHEIYSIAFGNNRFIAVGSGSTFLNGGGSTTSAHIAYLDVAAE
ncbi:hypothetical protein [Treponema primitia]|nr:hypothetical protein [Treponema primitia]